MIKKNGKIRFYRAMTLLELVLAMVMITIIFAAILPQFAAIGHNWDSKQGSSEALQNGRVLIDHINRNLSKAKRITVVSASTVTNGYIQFVDNNDVNNRYDIASSDSYVEYGPVGTLADLAGPVSSLQFTCYDACNISTPLSPVTDTNVIRVVQVDVTVTNSALKGQNKTFTTKVYLRTNANIGKLVGYWKLDEASGLTAADGSGSGNNGTLNGGPTWNSTGGLIDGALTFDGTDDYVNLGTDSSLNFGSSKPFTVAAWVKTTEDYGEIVSFRSSTDDGVVIDLAVGYDGVTTDAGKAMILVRQDGGSGGYANVKGGSVNDGLWHHVAAVRGSGSTIELFLDGVSQGTASGSESGGEVTTDWRAIGSERRWVITSYGTADQRYLAGVIDDVRIYNCALSAGEIAGLANILRYMVFNETKASSDSNTSVIIPTPATNTNDLLIAAVATNGSVTISPPSGWTQIDQGSNQITLGAWWRFAAASEPASHQFTWTGGEKAYGWMMRFKGQNLTSPINTFASAISSGSATPTSPAVTTTTNRCQILRLGAFDNSDITVDSPGLSGNSPITMDASGGSVTIPTYQAAGTAQSGTAAVTVAWPAHQAGDIALLFVESCGGQAVTLSTPAGFVNVLNSPQSTGTTTNGTRLTVFWCRATSSSMSSPTVADPGDHVYGIILTFRNVVATGNPWDVTAGGTKATASTTTTFGTVTTNVNNDLIVLAASRDNDSAAAAWSGWTNANLSGLTERSDGGTTQGNGGGVGVATGLKATAGSVGSSTATVTSSVDGHMTIALKPIGNDTVSGGAGYVTQSLAGNSGASTFSLTASDSARMLTIAIAPSDPNNNACCQGNILP